MLHIAFVVQIEVGGVSSVEPDYVVFHIVWTALRLCKDSFWLSVYVVFSCNTYGKCRVRDSERRLDSTVSCTVNCYNTRGVWTRRTDDLLHDETVFCS